MHEKHEYIANYSLHLPALWAIYDYDDDQRIKTLIESFNNPDLIAKGAEARGRDRDELSVTAPKIMDDIAVIPLMGEIISGLPTMLEEWGFGTSPERFAEDINALAENSKLKTVYIHARTPGGTVAGTQIAHDAVNALAQNKEVITYGDLICSAGYWITSPSHQIIGPTSGIFGSIGAAKVLMGESKDYPIKVIRSGKKKMLGASGEKITKEVEEEVGKEVNALAQVFWDNIADTRTGLTSHESVLREGGVFVGQDAVDNGLLDGMSASIHEVIESGEVSRNGSAKGAHRVAKKQDTPPVEIPETGASASSGEVEQPALIQTQVSISLDDLEQIKKKARKEGQLTAMQKAQSSVPDVDDLHTKILALETQISDMNNQRQKDARQHIADQALLAANDIVFPEDSGIDHKAWLISKVTAAAHSAKTDEEAIEAAQKEVESIKSVVGVNSKQPEKKRFYSVEAKEPASRNLVESTNNSEPSVPEARSSLDDLFSSTGGIY